DMAQYGPTDIEGLGSDPVSGNLLVGGRVDNKIYEVTKQGALVQTIDASGISGMRYISGLVQAPASDGSGRRDYWTVDRNIDNGPQPSENDGQIFELAIPDDDQPPSIVPGQASIVEGNTGTELLQIPVSLSAPSGQTVTASWKTLNDTAVAPGDFTAASGTVTFAPGQTTKTVAVTIQGDTLDEQNERLLVSFTNPVNATIGGFYGLGFGTIINDDPPPKTVPGQASITQGNNGTKLPQVPHSLSAPSAHTVTASWNTLNATAV